MEVNVLRCKKSKKIIALSNGSDKKWQESYRSLIKSVRHVWKSSWVWGNLFKHKTFAIAVVGGVEEREATQEVMKMITFLHYMFQI